jgi:hypothetical protein
VKEGIVYGRLLRGKLAQIEFSFSQKQKFEWKKAARCMS